MPTRETEGWGSREERKAGREINVREGEDRRGFSTSRIRRVSVVFVLLLLTLFILGGGRRLVKKQASK